MHCKHRRYDQISSLALSKRNDVRLRRSVKHGTMQREYIIRKSSFGRPVCQVKLNKSSPREDG
ncbi:uncharacterized protein STEHIDRAFT_124425 [Stereum hirsutum FP-91666 SS1]|uniref:uncharacterized protein n=1 Tax=Stereum hirsutum (strain FP-91666) TaxID=721885 RepID=UPI000444A085|nr:uncharacterized protein STEHIDRAFT_124425 [Stereum hirsutum FP-91666 SS1]EIM82241.1 hypothetical protein STEHIDRAFT_124425 [Stereum hirsutum FP-91666 SS1]